MLASYHTKMATPLLIEIITDDILNDEIWKHLLNTVITHTHTHNSTNIPSQHLVKPTGL